MLCWSPGGAADEQDLMAGDEVLAVNGADVTSQYRGPVEFMVRQAVRAGQVQLRIRRAVTPPAEGRGRHATVG